MTSPPTGIRPAPDATPFQRTTVLAVRAASWVALRLPDSWLHRVAHVVGAGWYLVARRQRGLARANLRRICEALVASGRASPRVATAAADPGALERLVRDAFGHRARYYVEVATAARHSWEYLRAHVEQDAALDKTLLEVGSLLDPRVGSRRPVFVGMHLGAVELGMFFLTQRHGLRAVAPMERVGNPALHAYLARSRAASGVRIVGLESARQEIRAALATGEIVGIVGDRDVAGSGVSVDLLGHPARLPVGAALLAVDAGLPIVVGAIRRTGWGEYAARMLVVDVPPSGTHRSRVMETMRRQAAALESLVADAPEQWTAVFFPIWADLTP
jgi:lauroyl/myristoyl acyltransferase